MDGLFPYLLPFVFVLLRLSFVFVGLLKLESIFLSLRIGIAISAVTAASVVEYTTPIQPQLSVSHLLSEITIGLAIALVLYAPFYAIHYASALLNPYRDAHPQHTIPSPIVQLVRLTFLTVFALSGGFHIIIAVITESYTTPIETRNIVNLVFVWGRYALSHALALASAGLLALAFAETIYAMAARWIDTTTDSFHTALTIPLRTLLPLGVFALSLGVWTNVTWTFAASAMYALKRVLLFD